MAPICLSQCTCIFTGTDTSTDTHTHTHTHAHTHRHTHRHTRKHTDTHAQANRHTHTVPNLNRNPSWTLKSCFLVNTSQLQKQGPNELVINNTPVSLHPLPLWQEVTRLQKAVMDPCDRKYLLRFTIRSHPDHNCLKEKQVFFWFCVLATLWNARRIVIHSFGFCITEIIKIKSCLYWTQL